MKIVQSGKINHLEKQFITNKTSLSLQFITTYH